MWITLIVLVAFVAVVQWRAGAREALAEREFGPIGQMLEVDGTPVHVWIKGEGPDLILIHGASGNLRDFTFGLADRLTDRYRVIAFDRPGLGFSASLPGTEGAWNAKAESPQDQAAILQEAADQLGVTSPIIVGHSYGGAVALAWGLARPDETAALVLLASVSNPWPGGLGWLYTINGSAVGSALVIPLITAFAPYKVVTDSINSIFAPQAAIDGYDAHIGPLLTLRRPTMRANAQQVLSLRPHIVEMSQQYAGITIPTEIVHGTADTIVPMEIHSIPLSKQIPGAVLTTLDGIGHMPQHTNPADVTDAIDRAAARAGLR